MYQEDYGKEACVLFNVFVDITVIVFFNFVIFLTIYYGKNYFNLYVFGSLFFYGFIAIKLIKNTVETYSSSLCWKTMTSYCVLWFGFFISVYAGWVL
ncbi:MAG: hypothetical protein V3575_05680 [Candidatus Absconditabacteria bacterium]